jgi:hypothetical protein
VQPVLQRTHPQCTRESHAGNRPLIWIAIYYGTRGCPERKVYIFSSGSIMSKRSPLSITCTVGG